VTTEPAVSSERVQREVVSFVRRSSRMRPGQRQTWRRHRDRYVVDVARRQTSTSVAAGAALDLPAVFGRTAPLVVEIGPGTGESLVRMAAQRPDANLLGFEVYEPALARLVGTLAAAEVGHVRLVQADAVDGLTHLLGPGSVAEVWLFFPDPWPKARHHKRRLVDRTFADLVAARLRPGGRWRLATDWQSYAGQMREVLDAHPAFVNEHGGWAPRWSARPVTRFERRGLDAGRRVFDLTYRRR
jgi:tRNA (guanine-N7-)-methyltransferase